MAKARKPFHRKRKTGNLAREGNCPLASGFSRRASRNPLLRDEAIPHPAHRLDEGSMLTEFLAQREDVHVDRSAATCEVPSPHVLQQSIAGKGDTGVFHEMKEQVELARCER